MTAPDYAPNFFCEHLAPGRASTEDALVDARKSAAAVTTHMAIRPSRADTFRPVVLPERMRQELAQIRPSGLETSSL